MERRRRALGVASIAAAAEAVAAQVIQLTEFLNAQHLGCYLAIEGELDPMPLLHCAQTMKKNLYLPIICSPDTLDSAPLEFHAYALDDPLLKGVHGINAPAHRVQLPCEIAQLDLIFLPLVAFDPHCNRLGRGAGHYDRTLNIAKQHNGHLPCLVGLAYEFQKIHEMATDKWDVPLDLIVTEQTLYRRPEKIRYDPLL